MSDMVKEDLKEKDITSLMEVVEIVLRRHFVSVPELWDELRSAGYEVLIKALRKCKDVKTLRSYVYTSVYGAMLDEYKKFKMRTLSLDYEYDDEGLNLGRVVSCEEKGYEDVELEMLIEKLAKSPEEKEFLRLLADGESIVSACRKVGRTRQWGHLKLKQYRQILSSMFSRT